jgi:1-acyl-sn-glycerol-3-phosphate acyltransferase
MPSKKNYPTRYYIRFIAFIVFSVFVFIYRIRKKLPKEVKNLKSPYLVISNHIGSMDPFVVGHFLPRFTHFVASDAVFRGRLLRFFFTRLGAIPIKKSMKDTKVIRDIMAVIRQGENVGLFPESLRNWAGETLPMDKSICKLIKLLKVPVVVAVLKGMNLFNPRWAYHLRRTKVLVEYRLLFKPDEIESLSEEELFKMLSQSIFHNEVEYQRKEMNRIYSRNRAEHISHALYVCPECRAIDSFSAKGNHFNCSNCNYDIYINHYSFFERDTHGKLYFDNMLDWYTWQNRWMVEFVFNQSKNNHKGVLFEDRDSKIYHAQTGLNLNFIGRANVKLYLDKMVLEFKDNQIIELNLNDLQIINPQKNERIEIFYNNQAYRIIGCRKGVSGLKWEVAVNAIWKRMGQENKLSPYLQSIFQKNSLSNGLS